MSSTPTKQYKTLPGPLRREERRRHQHGEISHSPLFGLNLNLSFSNLISSGVNFFDNLRKKTPSTPHSSASDSSSSVSGSGDTGICEAIEMHPIFPSSVEVEAAGSGQGHEWLEIGSHNPAWCDLCGEMIWGLYDTGAWQCGLCNYTVHLKCRDAVRLDCAGTAHTAAAVNSDLLDVSLHEDDTDGMVQSLLSDDEEELSFSSYTTAKASQLTTDTSRTLVLSEPSDYVVDDEQFHTLQDVEDLTPDTAAANHLPQSLLAVNPEHVSRFVSKYNAVMPVGQGTDWCPDKNIYSGYIRVEMNLTRPINVISGTRPPSIYNIMSEDTINDRTLTTFYLPPGTEKALHITSQTTTQDVVRVLLKKFRVADNPHKYALYERNMDDTRKDSLPKSKSLSRLKLRRLNEDEKPLLLAILWMKDSDKNTKFVMQENDPGEIQWEQFSLPELKNFLLILDREEAWYKRRIHEKYETVQQTIHELLQDKRPDKEKEKLKGKEYVY